MPETGSRKNWRRIAAAAATPLGAAAGLARTRIERLDRLTRWLSA